MRARGRTDSLQAEIVTALRRCGCSVLVMSAAGNGVPDLLVGRLGRNFALEVKDPKGVLTPAQRSWFASWRGQACVVRSSHEALQAVGIVAK